METRTEQLFAWSDSYRIGIDEVDAQHKELVRLLNDLHISIREHHGSATSREILNRLVNYTRTHFLVEESLMRVSGYPEFEAHRHQHEALIAQIGALQDKLDAGITSVSFELLRFLKRWLMHHINGDDKQFGAFFSREKILSAPATVQARKKAAEKTAHWWNRFF